MGLRTDKKSYKNQTPNTLNWSKIWRQKNKTVKGDSSLDLQEALYKNVWHPGKIIEGTDSAQDTPEIFTIWEP